MATTMKGIYKVFKFITQIFVVKERELEIGYPTDVKHVAHIGWDGTSCNAPSWMNGFKTPDFSTSLGNMDKRRDSSPISTSDWSSLLDIGILYTLCSAFKTWEIATMILLCLFLKRDMPESELPNLHKKHRRKSTKSTSSSKSSAFYTRSSRATK